MYLLHDKIIFYFLVLNKCLWFNTFSGNLKTFKIKNFRITYTIHERLNGNVLVGATTRCHENGSTVQNNTFDGLKKITQIWPIVQQFWIKKHKRRSDILPSKLFRKLIKSQISYLIILSISIRHLLCKKIAITAKWCADRKI